MTAHYNAAGRALLAAGIDSPESLDVSGNVSGRAAWRGLGTIDVPFDEAEDVGSIEYRLAPIDVGFDLRRAGIEVLIGPEERLRVSYATDEGQRRVLSGPRAGVLARLAALGFAIEERR